MLNPEEYSRKYNECLRKKRYYHYLIALSISNNMKERLGIRKIHPYKCSWCEFFHIGKSR